MALVQLTVRRSKLNERSGKNKDSETQTIDDAIGLYAIPTLCKKEGISDGLVNSEVKWAMGRDIHKVWVTETVDEIAALS